MSVLDRASLEASPLADLHAIASELSIDGYRRLRRPALVEAILERAGAEEIDEPSAAEEVPEAAEGVLEAAEGVLEAAEGVLEAAEEVPEAGEEVLEAGGAGPSPSEDTEEEEEEQASPRRRRGRRGGRSRATAREETAESEAPVPASASGSASASAKASPGEDELEADEADTQEAAAEDEVVEGVVELLANGSGFVRVSPPDPSDDDVYISAAQVKRCELVSGDRIAGPRRAPRRSERFASLVRIDTINGRPAEEVADSTRFDDLPAVYPTERFRLGSDDPTIKAIEFLAPFGRGSRVTLVGPALSGKTEALRLLAGALASQDDIQVSLALAGVRPEEIASWSEGPIAPAAAVSFAFSQDAQANAVELVVDQARRVAARGAHAVVLIDTLDGLHAHAARKAIAAARNIVGGGSLTMIATASQPMGGETTVIALDRDLTSTGRFPAVDLLASGTLRPELLVGEAGAEAIAQARADAQ